MASPDGVAGSPRAARGVTSAGLLVYRRTDTALEVLLAHPGGPFWARRDDGAWSIPKGEIVEGESAFRAASREFHEEVGVAPPDGQGLDLGEVRQRAGKRVMAWAVEGSILLDQFASNSFEMEWPPKSGVRRSFPEIDRVAWFDLPTAHRKILDAQEVFLERLVSQLDANGSVVGRLPPMPDR
jgi:predicted NUDIX family NTP pyrophosphohydrolase